MFFNFLFSFLMKFLLLQKSFPIYIYIYIYMSANFLKELVLEFPRFNQKKTLLDKIDFHSITFCRLRIRKHQSQLFGWNTFWQIESWGSCALCLVQRRWCELILIIFVMDSTRDVGNARKLLFMFVSQLYFYILGPINLLGF